jgi:Fe-S-cluster containining protein
VAARTPPAQPADGPDPTLDAADDALVCRFDESMADAAERAGSLFGCGPGNSRCCRGPFPINLLDARRLGRGMIALASRDPARAEAVRRRAARVVRRFWKDFPGDPRTGVFTGDEEAKRRFCGSHGALMCPALDGATGRCTVYEWRPLACRAMGPPVRLRGVDLAPCPYCFGPASADDVEQCRATPDPDGQEGALQAELEARGGRRGNTLIAFALVQGSLQSTQSGVDDLPD